MRSTVRNLRSRRGHFQKLISRGLSSLFGTKQTTPDSATQRFKTSINRLLWVGLGRSLQIETAEEWWKQPNKWNKWTRKPLNKQHTYKKLNKKTAEQVKHKQQTEQGNRWTSKQNMTKHFVEQGNSWTSKSNEQGNRSTSSSSSSSRLSVNMFCLLVQRFPCPYV